MEGSRVAAETAVLLLLQITHCQAGRKAGRKAGTHARQAEPRQAGILLTRLFLAPESTYLVYLCICIV